jgi:hypothetical protein
MNEQTSRTSEAERATGALYVSPRDVVEDPNMTVDEKRALLASWASDARAVANAPALRKLDNGAILFIDDVLEALKQLDRSVGRPSRTRLPASGSKRDRATKSGILIKLGLTGKRRRRDDDDDDDPPPCPVTARPPRPLPLLEGAYAA